VRVIVSKDGNPPYNEARYVDPREYYSLTDWQQNVSYLKCTVLNPIYTMWGQVLNTNPIGVPADGTIYIGPNTDNLLGTVSPDYDYPEVDSMSGYMDCILAPLPLVNTTDVIGVPYDYENLVILSTLARVFSKFGEVSILKTLHLKINEEKGRISKLYQESQFTKKRDLDIFVEPVPPLSPLPDTPGELKDRLVK
jgi:hypothetical protein